VGPSVLVVFLSLILWAWVLGPVGMVLAVPLMVGLKIVMEVSDGTRWLAILLAPATEISARVQEREIPTPAAREGRARLGGVMFRGIAMFYRFRVAGASGIGAAGPRQVQNMARDVCSPTQYRSQEPD